MNKVLKYGLISVGALLAVLIAAAAYIAATFNPNDYKPQVQRLVKEKLDRTLRFGGDIKLAFYPTLGVDLSGVSLSERGSEKEFAAIDSARVALQLMPLLSKQLVVNRVEVHGLRANLVKRKNGTTNIDDLAGKDKATEKPKADEAQAMQFDIDHVVVDKAALSYTDEASGAKYSVADLSFKTGKIRPGTPADIELVAKGLSAPQSKANLDARLKTRLDYKADPQHFKLDALDLEIKGEAAGFNPLAVTLKGTLEGDDKAIRSNEITLDVDGRQGERALKVKVVSPLTADLAAKRFSLPKIVASVNSTNPKSAGAPLALNVTGSANADVPKQNASLEFVTKLDESTIHGKAGVTDFDPLAYVFDLNIDKLDVDRYTGTKSSETKAAEASKGAPAKPEEPLDLSALKGLNARGSVKIGALKASNLHMQNARVDIKAANGRLDLNPLVAQLYQGTMNGSVSVVAATTPQVSLKQSLSGISIGPLLRDAAGKDLIEGRGTLTLDVAGSGRTASEIKRALDGSAAVHLTDGALKGFDIAGAIRSAKDKLASIKGEAPAQSARPAEKTDFSELKASFKITNGVAHNSDLSLMSPLLRVGGEGNVNIGNDSLDYLAKATLVATAKGQGGKSASELQGLTVPVRISGPFANLSYKVDVNAMISGVAKQQIEEKKEEVKAKVQEKLKDQLKGLFKR